MDADGDTEMGRDEMSCLEDDPSPFIPKQYHGHWFHVGCFDRGVRSRHRMMRTACGDDAAGRKKATEADIHMMETKPEEWRANVCMAKSGTTSRLKQMRNTAFDFARSFNTTAEVERAVIR